jgi:putative transposase
VAPSATLAVDKSNQKEPQIMKNVTKTIKRTNRAFEKIAFEGSPLGTIADLIQHTKSDFDHMVAKIKVTLIEFLLFSERESLAGPDYAPISGWQKWGTQSGSVYAGGERIKVNKPRLRKGGQEVPLSSYEALRNKSRFSDELLQKSLKGISTRDYGETLSHLLGNFGISKSSVSRHLVEATTHELRKLKERTLEDFKPFAIFLDGYHLGGEIFIVALGINTEGFKKVLGFWQGATENHSVCQELFADLEARKLALSENIIYVTDGGKGVIKALRDRFGKNLVHQRCTVHKDRNIQNHLAKKYRKAAHRRFRNAIDCHSYKDAKAELKKMEVWLEQINPSAADSLRECQEELLMVHRLEVPSLLRKTLHSTNPIESMFAQSTWRQRNIKNILAGKTMPQRWLGTTLLNAEKQFRRVKGHLSIAETRRNILQIRERNEIMAV